MSFTVDRIYAKYSPYKVQPSKNYHNPVTDEELRQSYSPKRKRTYESESDD